MMGFDHAILLRAVLIAVAMLIGSLVFAPNAMAINQFWYLTDVTVDPNHVMQKGSAGGGGTPVTVSSASPVIWIADEAAQTNVGFAAGTWGGKLRRVGNSGPDRGTVRIGVWDGFSFTSKGSGAFSFRGTGTKFRIPANAFDVPQGNWLAFETDIGLQSIPAQPSAKKPAPSPQPINISIITAGSSYVSSPNSDPGYPVPDGGAWLMFAAGLGAIGLILLALRHHNQQAIAIQSISSR